MSTKSTITGTDGEGHVAVFVVCVFRYLSITPEILFCTACLE